MASFPRAVIPIEVSSLEMPGPLIAKAQSGRVNIRATQQIGRTWMEKYLINVRSINGRALLATVGNLYRNGTIFSIDHRDHLTPLGAGGGSPLVNQSPQLVVDPENFGAWSIWGGAPTRTSGQNDPFGGTAAYLLTANSASAAFNEIVAFTGNATKADAWFLRAGSSLTTDLYVYDNTAAAVRHQVRVTWSGGVPTLSTQSGGGTLFAVEPWGGGWYRLSLNATGVIAANSNVIIIFPDAVVGTGSVYAFGVNAWNSTTPAGYIGPSHPQATGSTVYLDGATASVTNWLRAGDIISIGGLAPTSADTNSQASGFVALPINPPIFSGGAPADNAVVTITGVTLQACILEPPTFPNTSGVGADFGELVVKFSESL